ncbi:hypothetical protein Droror1_Dr00020213 [Drosera rotundifolia]
MEGATDACGGGGRSTAAEEAEVERGLGEGESGGRSGRSVNPRWRRHGNIQNLGCVRKQLDGLGEGESSGRLRKTLHIFSSLFRRRGFIRMSRVAYKKKRKCRASPLGFMLPNSGTHPHRRLRLCFHSSPAALISASASLRLHLSPPLFASAFAPPRLSPPSTIELSRPSCGDCIPYVTILIDTALHLVVKKNDQFMSFQIIHVGSKGHYKSDFECRCHNGMSQLKLWFAGLGNALMLITGA